MVAHRWMGLGIAEFTPEQARGWADAEGGQLIAAQFTMNVGKVICLRCGESFPDAPSECARPVKLEAHSWIATTTVMMTDDEALAWMRPDEPPIDGQSPKTTNVICVLCGKPYEEALEICEEQEFWR